MPDTDPAAEIERLINDRLQAFQRQLDAELDRQRNSAEFVTAVRQHADEYLRDLKQAQDEETARLAKADAEADQAARDAADKARAEQDAADLAEREKWEGHTHTWETKAGTATCTECEASMPAAFVDAAKPASE